ncbi:GDSL esterase/lipase [Panicum miliaceum]|uniref:GDSL esterase/lipase n=1 Tax=Panicum miliaceum TaxID=4540 RepID=A0A3L6TCR7_PANMI|nr:GDSL esterase/lipase [Panicum miliaceum]
MPLLPCMTVLLAISLVMQLLLRGGAADRVLAVIVFGDSTADTGNNNFVQTLLRAASPTAASPRTSFPRLCQQ